MSHELAPSEVSVNITFRAKVGQTPLFIGVLGLIDPIITKIKAVGL